MARLSGKKVNEVEETKKPEPVKAQPKNNGIGGIFTAKVAAIWKKIFS